MLNSLKKSFLFIYLPMSLLLYSPLLLAADPVTQTENKAATTTTTTPASATAQPSVPVGQVVWVKGTVKAIDANSKERILQRRDTISKSDTIVTDKTSTGEVVFTDGGLLTLRPGSTVKISDYKYNKDAPSDNKSVVDVLKGGFRTITGAISKANPEGYKVNTPVATIGVRGTDFSIHYKSCPGIDCGAAVKINVGSIQVRNSGGSLILSADTDHLYTQVVSMDKTPVVSTKEPASLINDVPIIPGKVDDAVMKASSAVVPVSTQPVSSTTTTGTTNGGAAGAATSGTSGGATSSPLNTPAAPSQNTQPVNNSFCIY